MSRARAPGPQPWIPLEIEPIQEFRVSSVRRIRARSPRTGDAHDFFAIDSSDWVNIVAITPDDCVVMVRQYRHGAQRFTLELVGGVIDEGEDPAAAALRECLEETGYRVRAARPLGVVNPNPALFSNLLHCFYALDAEPESAIQNTATEVTEAVLVPVSDLEGLLVSGEIDHALVVATLWRYLSLHRRR